MFETLFRLPQLSRTVWILFVGRLLSAVGTGFVLFYSSIFFTSKVGFTYTELGFGLAAGSVAGVVGRFLGGSLSDTPGWGRRRTLLLSLGIAAFGAALFALSTNFALFSLANLVAGFSVGLYWPASESAIADLTTPAERGEAYGLTRGGDSLGLGLGAALGAALIAFATDYRLLFISIASLTWCSLRWCSLGWQRLVRSGWCTGRVGRAGAKLSGIATCSPTPLSMSASLLW